MGNKLLGQIATGFVVAQGDQRRVIQQQRGIPSGCDDLFCLPVDLAIGDQALAGATKAAQAEPRSQRATAREHPVRTNR
jgi:hypothetical protein